MAVAAHAHAHEVTGPPESLLCALTGGEHDEHLVQTARRLAGSTHLRPRFVHVASGSVWAARSMLRQAGVRTAEMRVEVGEPGAALLRVALEERAALIVVAVDIRLTRPARAVARYLIAHARAPLLFVPPGAEPDAAAVVDAGPRAADLVGDAQRPVLVVPR